MHSSLPCARPPSSLDRRLRTHAPPSAAIDPATSTTISQNKKIISCVIFSTTALSAPLLLRPVVRPSASLFVSPSIVHPHQHHQRVDHRYPFCQSRYPSLTDFTSSTQFDRLFQRHTFFTKNSRIHAQPPFINTIQASLVPHHTYTHSAIRMTFIDALTYALASAHQEERLNSRSPYC